MIKRKNVSTIISMLLILSFLIAGCSSSSSGGSSDDNKISVLLSAGEVGQFNAWQARTEEFTKETGIEVEYIIVPYENLLEDITTAGISGSGAYDVVAYLDTMGPSIQQFLEPLNEYAEEDDFEFNRWPEAVLNLSTYDDKVYSLPVRSHVQMLFYRKDIFEELNIDSPETWEELVSAGQKVQDNTDLSGIVPYYGAGNNGQNLYMWTSYLWSNGGEIFDENMKPVFNNKNGVEATERYISLLDTIAPAGSKTFGEQDARTNFQNGKSAMWIGWWWAYSGFNSDGSELADNVGFAQVPKWDGKESVSNVSSFPMAMTKGSQNKDAAWEYLKWLAEPEMEKDIVMDTLTNESPAEQHSIVVTQKANLKDEKLNELSDNFYNVGLKNFQSAKTFPTIPEWPQVADILSTAMNEMATGKEVKPTLDQAAQRIEELMKEQGYYE
ncbi:multiple sugar transport system substrate-binding protein [Halobacillus dabanensis]|uniref:Multiple sugar transport system substrate-binding protein n=2 Tax=Halobacillus dabanensis TaxID=240302 RepID=A0A1I3WDK8_HALDA|nr:multiple sugar transport system substrate-binding protein [Halobacillus dabanensis]